MTLRLIQVGLGGIGSHWHRTVLTARKDVEVVAWVEIAEDALARAVERWPLPQERCFQSLEQALAQCEADAVLITASLPGHVPAARTALEAGKHVLMEKPFAPTMAEARELVELAASRELILLISQNYRYFPSVQAAKELVHTKQLGDVGSVNIDFRYNDNTAPVETNRHYHIWQPLLADMAIHHFDLLRFVLEQEPVAISCVTWNPSWSRFDEPPAGAATITFDGGTVVSYRGSWISFGQETTWTGEWHMDCARGEIIWSDRSENPALAEHIEICLPDGTLRPVELPQLAQKDFRGSLAAFIEAIETGKEPGSSGRHNLRTLALMFASIESAEHNGAPVEVARFL